MTIQSHSLGAPLRSATADRRSPVPGTYRRRFCAREKETSGRTFRRGQETRAELGTRICQYLSRFPLFSRGKSSNTPKTLPWTDKFCQIVRKQIPMIPAQKKVRRLHPNPRQPSLASTTDRPLSTGTMSAPCRSTSLKFVWSHP
jgi:hypothetical protein